MRNKSFLTTTTINRLVSMTNRISKEKYNNNLINSQGGNEKTRSPEFNLKKVEFNITTRIARIEILETQQYRTIQKYITQNYQRYPIYSEWKTKEKIIKKTLKLSNAELELLNESDDDLIKMFADEIIIQLNNTDIFPSWFIKKYLKKELDHDIYIIKKELNSFIENQNNKIVSQQESINTYNNKNEELNILLNKQQNKKDKIVLRLTKISQSKPNAFKNIFSLGIYNYLISNKRKEKINKKLNEKETQIENTTKEINNNNNLITKCLKFINISKINISKKDREEKNRIEELIQKYNKNISNVKPLSNIVPNDKKFTMLKLLSGLEYEKIVGVYIIHNKEKDKYYVGQSKDVMKRIKQHFNGTIPKNSIFAEDYYTSQIENRDDLFEVKIIKCKTKDELDKLEKQLIYEYDSWNNGYNGTSGNI